MFYLNLVGYKDYSEEAVYDVLKQFYLNLVGYKAIIFDPVFFCEFVLSELSGI